MHLITLFLKCQTSSYHMNFFHYFSHVTPCLLLNALLSPLPSLSMDVKNDLLSHCNLYQLLFYVLHSKLLFTRFAPCCSHFFDFLLLFPLTSFPTTVHTIYPVSFPVLSFSHWCSQLPHFQFLFTLFASCCFHFFDFPLLSPLTSFPTAVHTICPMKFPDLSFSP